jgi:two-component system, cell cycle response regulator DivK
LYEAASGRRNDEDLPSHQKAERPSSRKSPEARHRLKRARGAGLILVVDDNADTRELLALYFAQLGYAVVTAQDGEAGVAAALHHRPDIILMDLSMPRLDGVGALKRLKADPRASAVPVILLTAYPHHAIQQGALEAGASVFLTKPCLPEDVEQHVRRLLSGTSTARVTGEELCAGCRTVIGSGDPRYRRDTGLFCLKCHDEQQHT